MDLLAAKISEVSADVWNEDNEQIASLKAKYVAARQKIDELKHSGEGVWGNLKAGIELAKTAIGEAMDSARSRFRQ